MRSREVEALTGVNAKTLRRWAVRGAFPSHSDTAFVWSYGTRTRLFNGARIWNEKRHDQGWRLGYMANWKPQESGYAANANDFSARYSRSVRRRTACPRRGSIAEGCSVEPSHTSTIWSATFDQLSLLRAFARSRRASSRSIASRMNSARFSFSFNTASIRASVPPLKRAGTCSPLILFLPTLSNMAITHPIGQLKISPLDDIRNPIGDIQ